MKDFRDRLIENGHPYIFIFALAVTIIVGGLSIKANNQTRHEVFREILKNQIEFPAIVFKQSILETNHFKSGYFRNNNNLFGMKHPAKRETTSRHARNKFAYYSSWKKSVEDYKIWQSTYYKGGDYLEFLNSIYNGTDTTTNYSNKLKGIRIWAAK